MRIVYFIYDYVGSGGAERIISLKANYLVSLGHEVYIISHSHECKEPFFYFDNKIKFKNLSIARKDPQRVQKFIEGSTEYLKAIDADIAIATSPFGVFKYLYKVRDRSKKIFELHEAKYRRQVWYAEHNDSWWGQLAGKLYSYNRGYHVYRNFDRFITLTNEDAACWFDMKNLKVIPNFISFTPNQYSDASSRKVISLGRLEKVKQYDHLIEAWSYLLKQYPDWTLEIYGEGSEMPKLKALVKQLELEKSVFILSPTTNVNEVYASASIFALTSQYEGFGLVLVEALSCGLPIVSYNCKCGPSDIVTDKEDGFLVKRGDKRAFADTLSLLIEDYELRQNMGFAARKNALRFNQDKIMSQWINLFDELVNEK